MKKFKKGDTVYQACPTFCVKNKTNFAVVVERIIKSCGMKQMTFVDRGNHGVYGKFMTISHCGKMVFKTQQEAFCYLEESQEKHTAICFNIFGDNEDVLKIAEIITA